MNARKPVQLSFADYQTGKRCLKCSSTGPWVFAVHARLISYHAKEKGFHMTRAYFVQFTCENCGKVNDDMTEYVILPGPFVDQL